MNFTSKPKPADQKKLLITFDYELFLGNRSGSVDECMIDPTDKLISIIGNYGVRGVFFVDTTYLLRLKEQSKKSPVCATDFKKIADQLCKLVDNGHFVYPHLHPHWIDAEYLPETNQWQLNKTEKYLFKNISEKERSHIFEGSVILLKDILHPQFPEYEVNAFRAGGWSIQPFTDFMPFFEKHKIQYEFSVLGGFYQFTDAQYFDFSDAPKKPVYKFSNDVCKENQAGNYFQFNISSIDIPPAISWLNKIWLKLHIKITKDHTFHKGEGQPSRMLNDIAPASLSGKNLTKSRSERVAIELITIIKLRNYLRFMNQNDYMHFISHPKMITRHNLEIFDKFLKKSFENYKIVTDFHMMIPE